jgi:hypothetical protein
MAEQNKKFYNTQKKLKEIKYELYRNMSPTQKLRILSNAYCLGQSLAIAGIRFRYPNASEKEVKQIWAKEHLGEELYDKVYGEKGFEGNPYAKIF